MHILFDPLAITEVLEQDGEILAYYSVNVKDTCLFVNSIQVKRGYQGLGLGREMMTQIEKTTKDQGLDIIELWVQVTNRAGLEFYRHMGFRMISKQGNNYLMRKKLSVDGENKWLTVK